MDSDSMGNYTDVRSDNSVYTNELQACGYFLFFTLSIDYLSLHNPVKEV